MRSVEIGEFEAERTALLASGLVDMWRWRSSEQEAEALFPTPHVRDWHGGIVGTDEKWHEWALRTYRCWIVETVAQDEWHRLTSPDLPMISRTHSVIFLPFHTNHYMDSEGQVTLGDGTYVTSQHVLVVHSGTYVARHVTDLPTDVLVAWELY